MVTKLLKRFPAIYVTCRPEVQCGSKPVTSCSHATRKVPPDLGCWASATPIRTSTAVRASTIVQAFDLFTACPPDLSLQQPFWAPSPLCGGRLGWGGEMAP